ncbi:MAG: KGG domain-containing protein [Pseudomonadota bacterium]
MDNNQSKKSGTSNRGFASMDPQRQREIASEGGRAAHEKGTAHEFTSEEAREAGRKGGQARSQNRARNNSQSGGSESNR